VVDVVAVLTDSANPTDYLTAIAEQWLEDRNILDLVCCMHTKFLFIFEMLNELDGKSHTRRELAEIAKASYGFDKENINQIEKRLRIFKVAKLVRNTQLGKNITLSRCTLTDRGRRLLKLIPRQAPEAAGPHGTPSPYDFLYAELKVSSRNQSDPAEFARATEDAFKVLGFEAALHGRKLLIHAVGAPGCSFSAVVYAKSGHTKVDYDQLNKRRKKFNADYGIVTGRVFLGEMVASAMKHQVRLLTVDDLEKLLRQQANVPINVALYKKVFEKPGIADISLIESDRDEIARSGKLVRIVMNCLLTENKNEGSGEPLTASDIYRSLRKMHTFARPPKVEEISAVLDFLSSPLIGCVGKSGDGYHAAGSLSDAAQKFAFYAKARSTHKI
jgi:hypothetical protein